MLYGASVVQIEGTEWFRLVAYVARVSASQSMVLHAAGHRKCPWHVRGTSMRPWHAQANVCARRCAVRACMMSVRKGAIVYERL